MSGVGGGIGVGLGSTPGTASANGPGTAPGTGTAARDRSGSGDRSGWEARSGSAAGMSLMRRSVRPRGSDTAHVRLPHAPWANADRQVAPGIRVGAVDICHPISVIRPPSPCSPLRRVS
ncbi:hypothetical protein GCM10022284_70940 [Streptomyces hundungensis]